MTFNFPSTEHDVFSESRFFYSVKYIPEQYCDNEKILNEKGLHNVINGILKLMSIYIVHQSFKAIEFLGFPVKFI